MKGRYILVPLLLVAACIFYFLPTILTSSDFFYRKLSEDEKYNQTYNAKRRELGIPLLPDEWYTENTSLQPRHRLLPIRNNVIADHWLSQIWSAHEELEPHGPYHKEKEIRRFAQEIDNEIDRFVYAINDTVHYLLELNYSYLGYNETPWECTLIIIEEGKEYNVNSLALSINQADSVLDKWGLPRPK